MRYKHTRFQIILITVLGWPVLAGAIQDAIPGPPPVNTTDRFGVNLRTGQVTAGLETVSIGGERGLSHRISMHTNHLAGDDRYGYVDKYAGNARYTTISNPDIVNGFSYKGQSYTVFRVMRVFGPAGSEDFLIYVGDELKENDTVTTGFRYEAMGDKRHTLEPAGGDYNADYLIWTTPDGTELYYERLGDPRYAGTPAYLRKIIYPNGLTLNIYVLSGVTSNTGFQLKYDYVSDPRCQSLQQYLVGSGCLTPEKHQIWANLQYRDELHNNSPASWSGQNPKYIVGINNAIEYCSPDSTSPCSLSRDWPTATFTWPIGMPMALQLGTNVFEVETADGGVTAYHFEAQDVMLNTSGDYVDSPTARYREGEMWSPRLVGIKSAGSDTIDRRYQYRNNLTADGVSANQGVFSFFSLESEVGIVESASGPDGSAGYRIGQPAGQGAVYDNISEDKIPMRVRLQTGIPGALEFIDIDNRRAYQFHLSYHNFVTMHNPVDGPGRSYHYDDHDGRRNLAQIVEYDGTASRFVMQAEYPADCTNRKTCNKPEWVKDAKGNRTDYTYHPESGQVKSITGPADNNGVRPQTRYTYEQKYATYKTGPNTIEQDDRGIWLLTREATCRTTATVGNACAGGPGDEVVTQYHYGPQDGNTPNNLQLRGVSVTAANAGGVLETRSTCYEYDLYGHRIGETSPKGIPAGACP